MILLQMPSTHMTHTEGSDVFNFSDLFVGILLIVTFILILLIIILLFLFKDQIKTKYSKKADFNEFDNFTSLSGKSITNQSQFENQIQDNESIIEDSYNLSYSIDEQAYQRERLMNLINNYPDGILQSKLPKLTNLSKATVSRRLAELVAKNSILREPRGRSILIIPKNA